MGSLELFLFDDLELLQRTGDRSKSLKTAPEYLERQSCYVLIKRGFRVSVVDDIE